MKLAMSGGVMNVFIVMMLTLYNLQTITASCDKSASRCELGAIAFARHRAAVLAHRALAGRARTRKSKNAHLLYTSSQSRRCSRLWSRSCVRHALPPAPLCNILRMYCTPNLVSRERVCAEMQAVTGAACKPLFRHTTASSSWRAKAPSASTSCAAFLKPMSSSCPYPAAA